MKERCGVFQYFILLDITNPFNIAVYCTDLGVASCGDNTVDAKHMIFDATKMYIEDLHESGESLPNEMNSLNLINKINECLAEGILPENLLIDVQAVIY